MTSFLRILTLVCTFGMTRYLYKSQQIQRNNAHNLKQDASAYLNTFKTTTFNLNKWPNLHFNVIAADIDDVIDADIDHEDEEVEGNDDEEDEEDEDDEEDEEDWEHGEDWEDEEDGVANIFDALEHSVDFGLDDSGIKLPTDRDLERADFEADSVGSRTRNVPLFRISRGEPKRFVVGYDDFEVGYIRVDDARMPVWTEERVSSRNVANIQHRHWELITLESKVPDGMDEYFGPDYDYGTAFDFVRINGGDVFPTAQACAAENCEICARSTFWDVFYRYVTFLTKMYSSFTVWSCVIYDDRYNTDDCEQDYDKVAKNGGDVPTHFVKVICCDNEDGTYRLECYKVPNQERKARTELRNFNVTRAYLVNTTGLDIMVKVPQSQIKHTTPHPGFMPQCFPFN